MAKRKTQRKSVEAVRHKDKRKNIPTEELRDFVREEEQQPRKVLYPRDPDLDPQLVWKGKDEQDAAPLEVPAVPVYIQEKIHPQAIIDQWIVDSGWPNTESRRDQGLLATQARVDVRRDQRLDDRPLRQHEQLLVDLRQRQESNVPFRFLPSWNRIDWVGESAVGRPESMLPDRVREHHMKYLADSIRGLRGDSLVLHPLRDVRLDDAGGELF
jgi:hypothetical protein